ncbi:MAG TPA: GNAT family N-acetyltransferase [Vicinamibacteria bacterium]|nr:GNAT family N-acetyltransferase [Vicinamibacteria bacterium]
MRRAVETDVPALLALINGYAERGLLLVRTEASIRARLADFTVAEVDGEVAGCAALTELGPGLAEVRSLAVRADLAGHGIGHALVEALVAEAGRRGFHEVLALTRRTSFFEALGFQATRRERFLDKLMVDCQACPLNLCCDETAMVRTPATTSGLTTEGAEGQRRGRGEQGVLSR